MLTSFDIQPYGRGSNYIGGHFGCAADWKGFGGGGGSFFAADEGVGAMKGPVVFAEVQLMLNAMVSGPATGGLARRG